VLLFPHERLRGLRPEPNLPLILQPDLNLDGQGLSLGSTHGEPWAASLPHTCSAWGKQRRGDSNISRLMAFHRDSLSQEFGAESEAEGGGNKAGGEGSPPG